MLIKDIMSRSVITANGSALVVDVCKMMEQHHIGSVIIVKDKIPLGIITERDIVNFIASGGHSMMNITASLIMKHPVFTTHPKMDIKKTLEFMINKRIRRLPIVEHKRLAGIVTYGDILREIQKELAEANINTEKLKLEVARDGLTHLYTQKYFKNFLDREVERVKRYGGVLSVLMIDVDHFKKINDTFGHDAGDYILQKVSFLINHNVRKINVVGRYGGDEFAIIAPISDIEGTKRLGERLRQFVEQTKFHYLGKIIKVTLSVGVASWGTSIQDGRGLLIKADEALYKSKRGGRNLVSWI